MEYIRLNNEMLFQGGFKSSECVLFVTGYDLIESVTFGDDTATKSVDVRYKIYKSLADKDGGQSEVYPVNFSYVTRLTNLAVNEPVTIDVLYNALLSQIPDADLMDI